MQEERNPYTRHTTRHRGITFRERADGSKVFSIRWEGTRVSKRPGSSEPFTTEKEALDYQAELRLAAGKGEKIVVNSKLTFSELAESWLEAKAPRLRPRTLDYYRSALGLVLLPRFGRLKVAQVDVEAIAKLIRDLEREGLHAIDPARQVKPLGQASVTNYVLKPLQGILDLAVRRRLIAANPIGTLTRDERPAQAVKAPPHEWTQAEIDELIAAAEWLARQPEARADYAPLLRLTVRLGLRLGEVLGLTWANFDREGGYLHVRRQWCRHGEYGPTKTKAGERSIPLPNDLRAELAALRLQSTFSTDEDPIFASRNGTPLSHRNVTRRGFEAARDRAGLDGSLSFHDLRHAAASRLIHEGHSPVVVARLLGHSDPSMTLRVYAHCYEGATVEEQIRQALAGGASS